MADQRVHIERSDWYRSTHSYNVVADGSVVFTGSWRDCYTQARELDSKFAEAFGGEHVCDARATSEGGNLEFVAFYGAPGVGQAWRCTVCEEEFAKLGGSFYPASEMRHELRPEDVI